MCPGSSDDMNNGEERYCTWSEYKKIIVCCGSLLEGGSNESEAVSWTAWRRMMDTGVNCEVSQVFTCDLITEDTF